MKFLGEFFGEIARQVIATVFFIIYAPVCFVVFDAFHITHTGTQVLVAVAPFLALAFWLKRNGKIS